MTNELGLNGYPRERMQAIALARIVALQSTLGWVAPMTTRPVFVAGPLEALAEVRKAPRKAAAKGKTAKPAMLTGEQFYDAWMAAVGRLRERHERWDLVPGAWQWCTLLPKHRRFTTAIIDDGAGGKKGGVTLKWAKDQKLPAPHYWAGGVLPAGVVVVEPIPPTLTPWVLRNWGPEGALVEVHPMLARLADARAEQIAADIPVRLAKRRRERIAEASRKHRNVLDKHAHFDRVTMRSGPYPDRFERAAAIRRELANDLRGFAGEAEMLART